MQLMKRPNAPVNPLAVDMLAGALSRGKMHGFDMFGARYSEKFLGGGFALGDVLIERLWKVGFKSLPVRRWSAEVQMLRFDPSRPWNNGSAFKNHQQNTCSKLEQPLNRKCQLPVSRKWSLLMFHGLLEFLTHECKSSAACEERRLAVEDAVEHGRKAQVNFWWIIAMTRMDVFR